MGYNEGMSEGGKDGDKIVRDPIEVRDRQRELTRELPESIVTIEGLDDWRREEVVIAFDLDGTLINDPGAWLGELDDEDFSFRLGVKELFGAMAEMVAKYEKGDVAIVLYTTIGKEKTMGKIRDLLRVELGEGVYNATLGKNEGLFLTSGSDWKVGLNEDRARSFFEESDGQSTGLFEEWSAYFRLRMGPGRDKIILPNMILIDDKEECLLVAGGRLVKVSKYHGGGSGVLNVEAVMGVIKEFVSGKINGSN